MRRVHRPPHGRPGRRPRSLSAARRPLPAAADLAEGLRRGYRGVHRDDVRLCLQADRYSFAMAAGPEDGLLVLRTRPA